MILSRGRRVNDKEEQVEHKTKGAAEKLPGGLATRCKEICLLHGCKPESVLPILATGLSEKLSSLGGSPLIHIWQFPTCSLERNYVKAVPVSQPASQWCRDHDERLNLGGPFSASDIVSDACCPAQQM